MAIDSIGRKLAYFGPGAIKLNPPASEETIAAAEEHLGVAFPPSFARFLKWHNGGWVVQDGLFGVPPIERALNLLVRTGSKRRVGGELWPASYVQVADDGCGNPFVLATDKRDERGECPVVFVDGIGLNVISVAGSNYLSFIWFLVNDVTRTTGPDGRPLPEDELPPDWRRRWMMQPDFLVAYDPGAARWLAEFQIDLK